MKNRQIWKRGVGLLAALALLAGLAPLGALAAPTESASAGSVVDTAYSDDPNAYEIYPKPHAVAYDTAAGAFTMTNEVNVVAGEGVDSITTDFLSEILTRFGHTVTSSDAVAADKTNIVLAVHGENDPATPTRYADLFTAADKYDPYILTAEGGDGGNGLITIVGKDTDCVYYGVSTLQMMFTSFNGEKFLPVRIEDYSNTLFRGFIEGFYGGYDDAGRRSQIRALRDVKGNMYVYASKEDSYHGGANWADEYPEATANEIKALVQACESVKVNYVWSLHLGIGGGKVLGQSDRTEDLPRAEYEAARDKVFAKLQSLYGLGVRGFHILNDDYNSGTHNDRVRLLNDVNGWLKGKGDCLPLVYCCSGYNTAWAGDGTEMRALAALDDDIYLYWTGGDVNSPITQENVNWAAEKSNQPIVTWLNYPCSEHAKSGLFLGNITHYISQADGITGQYGLLSNGISSPEANKVAHFQLMSWCWNREAYSTYVDEVWQDCFKYLQPEVYESYLTIARNVSNCPGSGRIPGGFPESEYLTERLEAVQTALLNGDALAEIPEAGGLMAELDNILTAIADFRENCANDKLKTEVEPWLKSLESVVTAGKNGIVAAGALNSSDISGAWDAFAVGGVALGKWDENQSSNPWYPANTRAKAGSRRLQPFAQAVLDYVEAGMARQFNPGGGLGTETAPYVRMAGQDRSKDATGARMLDGNTASYASYEVNQKAGDYFGVDLGGGKVVTEVDILQGKDDTHHDYFHNGCLEYSTDGVAWTTLVNKVNSHHIHVGDLAVAARFVRLRLTATGYGNKENYYTYIREFSVTTREPEALYTNAAGVDAAVADNGGTYILSVASAALEAGDYVGIRLPELMGIRTVTTENLPSGVTVEYSVNSETWTQGAPDGTTLMGYVRLRADSAADLSGVTLTASGPVETRLSFVGSNMGVYAGSWDAVVDGDKTSLVHTNIKQAYGQYAIFDLGGRQPVHDVTVWIPESGNDIPHNLDIFVGDTDDPNGDWETIARLRSNNYTMEVPYRFFRCDGAGKAGRYLKLAIPDIESSNWIKINELEVNTTVTTDDVLGAVSATSGAAENGVDGNLLTFVTPQAGDGQWQKLFQEPTSFDRVTILRGAAGADATVEVEQNGAWQNKGKLAQSATTVTLTGEDPITGVKITWAEGAEPAIAEVIFAGETGATGETPTVLPNIYEKPADPSGVTVANGTAAADVGLPETVNVTTSAGEAVSVPVVWDSADYDADTEGEYTFTGALDAAAAGLSNPGCFVLSATVTVEPGEDEPGEGNLVYKKSAYASGQETAGNTPDKAVDGQSDENSRWNSNYMKYHATNPAWLVVDMGEYVEDVTAVSVKFHKLVWPTRFKIQVAGEDFTPVDLSAKNGTDASVDAATFTGDNAEDAACWTTLKTLESDNYPANPLVTVEKADFDTALPAGSRYLRLYFTGLNPAVAGHCVSVWELTVGGVRGEAPAEPSVVSVEPVSVEVEVGTAWADLELPETVEATLSDETTAELAVTWDGTDYDADTAGEQTFEGTLTLCDGVTNPDDVKASLTVKKTAKEEPTPTPKPSTSTPATTTDTKTEPDGTKVTTVTDRRTGTVTETTEKPDGTTEVVETKKDGTVTETVTDPEGAKTEKVTTPDEAVTITVTDPEGEEVAKVEIPAEIPEPEEPFVDVDGVNWAKEAINSVAGLGLVKGIGDQKYDPVAPMTRGSLATVLHRLSQGKTDYQATFKDVAKGTYYTEGVAWAAKVKVVTGYTPETFAPDDIITREQLAVMLARYAKLIGMDTTADKDVLDEFVDGEKTGPWAVDGMAWAVKNGILKGKGANDLDPTANVSRAEVAIMLDRFLGLVRE